MKAELITDIKYRGQFVKRGVIVNLELPRTEINELIEAGAIKKAEELPVIAPVETKKLEEVIVKEVENINNKTSSASPEALEKVVEKRGRKRKNK